MPKGRMPFAASLFVVDIRRLVVTYRFQLTTKLDTGEIIETVTFH